VEFDEMSHNHDERTLDRHGSAHEGDEKNHLEHDEKSEKTHLCDEMARLEMTENDGGSEDDGTSALLLVDGSGAVWMFDEHADDVAEGFPPQIRAS